VTRRTDPATRLRRMHDRLVQAYGPQHWWPAETAFEMILGAYLTQNTSWKAAEGSLANLREAGTLTLDGLRAIRLDRLQQLVRPSGFFTRKAPALKAFVAMLDEEFSGSLDVLVANERGPVLIYKNTVNPQNQWIEFQLEGTTSNRSAIGAEVALYWNGQQQIQEVSGGSGFAAQNDRRLHFGLGKDPRMEKAVIRWPSGKVQTIENLTPGKLYTVKEPA